MRTWVLGESPVLIGHLIPSSVKLPMYSAIRDWALFPDLNEPLTLPNNLFQQLAPAAVSSPTVFRYARLRWLLQYLLLILASALVAPEAL